MNNSKRKSKPSNYIDMDDQNIIEESYANNLTAVKALVEMGHNINTVEPDTGFTPLHIAVCRGYTELFRYIVSNDRTDLWAQDRWGRTPSVLALAEGDGFGLAKLIERQAEIRSSSNDGGSAPAP